MRWCTNVIAKLSLQAAAFQPNFGSGLAYNSDSSQEETGVPSLRRGIEVSGQYHPFRSLELNADLAFTKPPNLAPDLAVYGFHAPFIADAPKSIDAAGVLRSDLGPWTGNLVWWRPDSHHLSDMVEYPRDKRYSEFNLNIGDPVEKRFRTGAGVANLSHSHDEAGDYHYTSLPGVESAEGVTGFQAYPLKRRSARFTVGVQV